MKRYLVMERNRIPVNPSDNCVLGTVNFVDVDDEGESRSIAWYLKTMNCSPGRGTDSYVHVPGITVGEVESGQIYDRLAIEPIREDREFRERIKDAIPTKPQTDGVEDTSERKYFF